MRTASTDNPVGLRIRATHSDDENQLGDSADSSIERAGFVA